ncbi:UBA/TS-N domain [Popillia japonica]|uniref:UBA/TS-N domain n=1 Tax=Popillia japonica TaxID=7064 RepID=A0AAW1IYD6_POPJA
MDILGDDIVENEMLSLTVKSSAKKEVLEVPSHLTISNEMLSLTVKSSAKKEVLEVPSHLTISNFKEIIARKFDVSDVHLLRLIYAGRILKDLDTLKSLNIKTGYTIYVVIKPQVADNSRHYTDSPDILRLMLNNNPALQEVMQRNPELGHAINNPSVLREAMEIMRNPNIANEFARSADRAMNNIESLPGGFNALQQMYHDIEEPLMSATNETSNPFLNLFTTQTSNRQGSENRDPLPNPWSSSESTLNDLDHDAYLSHPLIQNMLEQLQNRMPELGIVPSPQMLQELQALLSNTNQSDEYENLRQQMTQNTNEPTANANISPEIINAIILPALLLSSIVRNQAPNVSNNNEVNSSSMSQLLSPLNSHNLTNNTLNFEERYRIQLQQLSEMGFINREANLQALITSFGDLNRAIEMLLSRNMLN